MLFFIIKNIFVSLVFIVSIHTIFIYFKENLTIPKTKDLVNKPAIEYEKIKREIEKSKNENINKKLSTDRTQINMKDELKDYLSQLNNNNDSTPIESTIQVNNPFNDKNNFTPV